MLKSNEICILITSLITVKKENWLVKVNDLFYPCFFKVACFKPWVIYMIFNNEIIINSITNVLEMLGVVWFECLFFYFLKIIFIFKFLKFWKVGKRSVLGLFLKRENIF